MNGKVNIRMERIERLFDELRYEIERGMMEGEVDESIGYCWVLPISKRIPGGVVWCEFRSRPTHIHNIPMPLGGVKPRLSVVGKGD